MTLAQLSAMTSSQNLGFNEVEYVSLDEISEARRWAEANYPELVPESFLGVGQLLYDGGGDDS